MVRRAVEDAQAADAEHRDDAQERKQRWGDAGQCGREHQALACIQGVRVHARPAREEIALRAVGLQRLDHVDAVHRCTVEPALLLQ